MKNSQPDFERDKLKTTHLIKRSLLAVAMPLILIVATGAQAQEYPSRAIRLIVPWPPGGATDSIARLLAQSLTEHLGQPVVVENKGGAGGNIGTEMFVHANPDGYTLLMATSSTNAANPHLYSHLGFDANKDFAPVAFVAEIPNILVVPANSPANTAAELIAMAKAKPGKLTYGSGGIGASQHLAGSMLKNYAKIDILHVPYKGSGPAAVDLMAGHINMMLDTGSMGSIHGKKLKALAVASKSRLELLPDVPTFDEVGVPGMYASAWYGVMAPVGTPKPIIERLNKEINRFTGDIKTKTRLFELGAQVHPMSSKQFGDFVTAEIVRYGVIVSQSGAKLEQ
jgi:tripartite-type tricarboxylate transporter receptor subunit TctC